MARLTDRQTEWLKLNLAPHLTWRPSPRVALLIALALCSYSCETSEPPNMDLNQSAGGAAGDVSDRDSSDMVASVMEADLNPSDLEPPAERPEAPALLGGDRPAAYVLPDQYDPQVSAPLVVLLHGYTSTASFQEEYFKLKAQTQQKGMILLLPNGRVNPDGDQFWSATDFCCDFYQQGDVDVTYLRALIEEAQVYFNIDTQEITEKVLGLMLMGASSSTYLPLVG